MRAGVLRQAGRAPSHERTSIKGPNACGSGRVSKLWTAEVVAQGSFLEAKISMKGLNQRCSSSIVGRTLTMPSASRRRKTQFLHTGQKKCGLGEGPLPSSGSPWVSETAGRYSDGERIGAGAALLTPSAMAGGGQERRGADPEADLPTRASTVPREFPIVRHSPSPSLPSSLRRDRIPSDEAQSLLGFTNSPGASSSSMEPLRR